MRPTIGHELTRTGVLTAEGLRRASDWRRANGGSIERALVSSGAVQEEELTAALARLSGLRPVTRERLVDADPFAVSALPADARRRLRALPFEKSEGRLLVAVADPANPVLITGLEAATGFPVELFAVADPVLEDLLHRWERLEERRERDRAAPSPTTRAPSPVGPEIEQLARALLGESLRGGADGFEVGIDQKGGYHRAHYFARPALSQRLPREVVPSLLAWLRARLSASDPIDGTSFVVDMRAEVGSSGLQRVVLTEAGPESIRLSFQKTEQPPRDCRHEVRREDGREGEVFCPRCGAAV